MPSRLWSSIYVYISFMRSAKRIIVPQWPKKVEIEIANTQLVVVPPVEALAQMQLLTAKTRFPTTTDYFRPFMALHRPYPNAR